MGVIARNPCNCGSGCQCRIVAGDGIIVDGTGSATDPLVVTAVITSFAGTVVGNTTPTVNVVVTGTGLPSDPMLITADSAIGMSQLTDVDDPSGPNLGDVPVWNGAAWEFSPPPTVAPGAVHVGAGLSGDGSFADPLLVAVSDTTTTATTGLATYIDSAGKLRAVPPTGGDWATLVGKPDAFPSTWDLVTSKPTSFPTTWAQVAGRPTISDVSPTSGTGSDGDVWLEW